jgi:hypothetical protein
MKVRISGGGEDDPKPKSKTKVKVKPTQAEIDAANAFAKDLGKRKGLFNAENLHVGGQIPKFVDEAGRELPPATQPVTPKLPTSIPNYVKALEWDKEKNLPYYIDQQTGYMQYVPKEFFYTARFNPNRGKISMVDVIAKK